MSASNSLQPKGGGDRIAAPEYFRLEQLQEEFNFATDEELNSDNRLKLLELREREVTEFRNMKMIPSHAHEISGDVFKVFHPLSSRSEDQLFYVREIMLTTI